MSMDILFHELSSDTRTQPSWMHNAYQDLQIENIFKHLSPEDTCFEITNEEFLCSIWTNDMADIKYRNDMILELYENRAIYDGIQMAVNHVKQMIANWQDNGYEGYPRYMQQLTLAYSYTEALHIIRQTLSGTVPKSEGLGRLKEWCDDAYESEKLENYRKVISRIKNDIPSISAVTMSVNVDGMLSPAHIMSDVCTGELKFTSIFEGGGQNPNCLSRMVPFSRSGHGSALQTYVYKLLEHTQNGLLKELRSTIEKLSFASVKDLKKLYYQWHFYVLGVTMKQRMEQRGKPMVSAGDANKTAMDAEGLYSVQLELEGIPAVPNNFSFSGFNIVTGGNQTGKTVFVKTTGQLQWLYQTGFLLPCKSVHMRIAHSIHTLFTSGEIAGKTESRMGFEIQRLKEITDQLNEYSIVYMNEPMTGTSFKEAIEICVAFIKHLDGSGIWGIMATNFIEIYENILMDGLGRDYLKSIVMQTEEDTKGNIKPNYKIALMPPNYMGIEPLKKQYELSLPQLIGRLPDNNAGLLRKVSQAIQYIGSEVQSNGDPA